jgi:hypothetical protein
MRPLAVVLALLLLGAPAADAKPVKCTKASKGCRKLGGATPQGAARALVPMAGIDPFAPAPAPTPTVEIPLPDPAPLPPPPPPARLGVVAREWSLTLSRSALPAGAALVELQNFGEDAHNLRIERTDGSGAPLNVPLAESGERQRTSGTLAPGDYKVYCVLPGHDAQGMHARLVVTQ